MPLQKTTDPAVWIEYQDEDVIRFWRHTDNKRWEIRGHCDPEKSGMECFHGSFMYGVPGQPGTGIFVRNAEEALAAWRERGDYPLETPMTSEFEGCCRALGLIEFVELPSGEPED